MHMLPQGPAQNTINFRQESHTSDVPGATGIKGSGGFDEPTEPGPVSEASHAKQLNNAIRPTLRGFKASSAPTFSVKHVYSRHLWGHNNHRSHGVGDGENKIGIDR
ncbi:hypothetical protein N7454_008693 [Penicillium verhagenii]|nr:hypothetical protein N7454_008693 [Penicillium verhagenii]